MRTTNSARIRASSDGARGDRSGRNSGISADSLTRTRDIVSLVAGSGDLPREITPRKNDNRAGRGRPAEASRGRPQGTAPRSPSQGDRGPSQGIQARQGLGSNQGSQSPERHPAAPGSRAAGGRGRNTAAGGRASATSGRAPASGGRAPASGRAGFASTAAPNGRIVREKGKKGGCVKEIIDPARFVKKAVVVEKTEYVAAHAFGDFGLNERILENIKTKGYVTPSPIQDKTISLVMEGKDVVGIANTGTGKTAAFALPMVHKLIHDMTARVLILAPTRELAQQIQEEIISFSKGCSIRTVLIIGGNSMNVQNRELAKNPRVIIATPGRLKDHIRQGTVSLSNVTYAVLDEVDRMLDMGFIRDIREIFSHVPKTRQSVFFSATIDKEVERLILDFSKDPVTVSVRENVTADGVDQDVVWFRDNEDRIEKLHDLLIKGCEKTIIFDDTKRAVEKLGKELKKRGFRVDQIHGDKSQGQRSRAIRRLKDDEIDVLVATDVAARGIDVSDISHVINYSQPVTYEDYVHRIGRTGRAGKTGQAYTFLQKA